MLNIDKLSRTPIYEQIETQIKEMILSGALKAGDKLPSVRALSLQLSINPNTIQKAYLELDRLMIIASAPGRGSFVSDNARTILLAGERGKLCELETLLSDLLSAGVSKETLFDTLEIAIKKYNNESED